MSLFTVCRLLRSRWYNLAQMLWSVTLREQLQSELKRLDGELGRRHQRLLKYRQKIERLHALLERREHRRAFLASQVLDRAGTRTIEELAYNAQVIDWLRECLQERERVYEELLAHFHHRKQQRSIVRAQLLCCPPSHRIGSEEESDSGYPF
jgi:DNA repair exonuclease SbcCD ATPase subunit